MTLDDFNQLDAKERRGYLLQSCHCESWAARVDEGHPFASLATLDLAIESAFSSMSEANLLEAFSGHPKIGDMNALRNKYAETATREQGQIQSATDEVLEKLKALNVAYEERFGFIFIVCASGKSAPQMLALLEARLPNERNAELEQAKKEQMAITRLRIASMFNAE